MGDSMASVNFLTRQEIHKVERAWAEAARQYEPGPVFPLEATRSILTALGIPGFEGREAGEHGTPGRKPAAVLAGFYYRDGNGDGRYTPGEETSAALLGAPTLDGGAQRAETLWNCYWFPGVEPGREHSLAYAVDGVRGFSATVSIRPGLNLLHVPVVPEKPLVYAVPHSHFDPEWVKTYEAYLAEELPNMRERLEVLRQDPSHGFSLDEESALRPLLERHPELVDEVRRRIEEGTAEPKAIVASGDLTMVLGESIIRQITVGERILAGLLGRRVSTEVFWNVDNYGTCFQLPQILAKSGRKYLALGEYSWCPREAWPQGLGQEQPEWLRVNDRGMANPHYREDMPFSDPRVWDHSEFFMRGLDGSTVLAHRSLYCGSPTTWRFPRERRPSHLSYFGFYGGDFSPPDRKLASTFAELNAGNGEHKCIIATSAQFFKAIENAPDIPAFTTESWMAIWNGSYESRVKGRQLSRRLECTLLAMESLAGMARLHDIEAPLAELLESWYLLLINHHHDPQMTPMWPGLIDEVVERYREVEGRTYRLFPGGLLDRIPGNERDGVAFAVFNPLPWPVTRVVAGSGGTAVVDHTGRPALVQPAGKDRFERPTALFLAENVPAAGWRSYYVGGTPSEKAGTAKPIRADGTVMENEHLRIEFTDGLVRAIIIRKSGRASVRRRKPPRGRASGPSVNEVFAWKDDGCICIVRPVDALAEAVLVGRSSAAARTFRYTETGPVRAVAETRFKLAGGVFTQRAILEAGARTVRFETHVAWTPAKGEGRRIRVAFPFAERGAAVLRDTPFAVVDGEQGHVIRPVNSWLGLASREPALGAALIHQGTCSIQAENDTMWMTLFRSVRVGEGTCASLWDKPGDNSLEAGSNTYTYWLYPFESGWEESGVCRVALEVNTPVECRELDRRSPSSLAAEASHLWLEPASLVVSAVKPADDGSRSLVVRVFNPGPSPVRGTLGFGFDAASVVETDFLERKVSDAVVEDGRVSLAFGPYEVKTVLFLLPQAPRRPAANPSA